MNSEMAFWMVRILAWGARARSARGSQNCAILSIIFPFIGNGACLCTNDVFFREVNTNKYSINTVLTSSYT